MDSEGVDVVRLVDLNLTSGIKGALVKCLDSGIDVFIHQPKTVSIWALPDDFQQSTDKCERLKKSNFREPLFNISSFEEKHRLKGGAQSVSLAPSIIAEDVLLLQLSIANIRELIALTQLNATDFKSIYRLSAKGKFKRIDSVVSEQYLPESFMSDDYYSFNKKRVSFRFDCDSSYFGFIACDGGKISIDKYDDPINHKVPINIELNDCFITSEQVVQLTEYRVQDIPVESPYFIPKECRDSTKLNKLAVVGHRLYEEGTLPPPDNVAKYIENELSIGKKEAEAARFFISPMPAGSMNEEYKKKVQFKHLIDVYKNAYVYKELDKERLSSKSNLPVDSFASYGYSDEKCTYAVKLITLDSKKTTGALKH